MDAVIVSLVALAVVPDTVGEALPAPRASRRAAPRRVVSPPQPLRHALHVDACALITHLHMLRLLTAVYGHRKCFMNKFVIQFDG